MAPRMAGRSRRYRGLVRPVLLSPALSGQPSRQNRRCGAPDRVYRTRAAPLLGSMTGRARSPASHRANFVGTAATRIARQHHGTTAAAVPTGAAPDRAGARCDLIRMSTGGLRLWRAVFCASDRAQPWGDPVHAIRVHDARICLSRNAPVRSIRGMAVGCPTWTLPRLPTRWSSRGGRVHADRERSSRTSIPRRTSPLCWRASPTIPLSNSMRCRFATGRPRASTRRHVRRREDACGRRSPSGHLSPASQPFRLPSP